ncbi:MAG: type IV pilus secretin PilQ [Gammaproteobacteria bacterium]|nr:type IV pilus secretin PilQ [Gammaproteobacteria bacterium]
MKKVSLIFLIIVIIFSVVVIQKSTKLSQLKNQNNELKSKIEVMDSSLKLLKSESGITSPKKTTHFVTQINRLIYVKASDIAKLFKEQNQSWLKNTSILADTRTNSLLIRASNKDINTFHAFIKALDVPMPEVLIEAYIVSLDNNYEDELGIKFGVTSGHHISGTIKGANELAEGRAPSDIDPADRLNVNLPAVANNAGHLGIALFKLSKKTLLDMELSALESEGRAEILSNPRLLTTNQNPAIIESGEEIPYQENVSQGVTATAFKKAVLKLEVTPQITPNKKIILTIKVNQDKRSSNEVQGVPSINTRQITTQVLMNDGQTVVLGGIYEFTKTDHKEQIPFLGDIPIIGVLFRYKKKTDNRRELLVFITPRIVS